MTEAKYITQEEWYRLRSEKSRQISCIENEILTYLFRLKQIKKRGKAKSKKVFIHRLYRTLGLHARIVCAQQQLLLVVSQPLPQVAT